MGLAIMECDDQMLETIKKIATQDRTAFRELYLQTSPKLFGVAMRILRDPEKASEVLQEAYLQIWRNANRFDADKGALEGWMVGIVRFRALDFLRRERIVQAMTVEGLNVENVATMNADNNDPAPETTIALWNCIDRLSDDQRNCIIDAHIQGFTHEELSNRHRAPIGTIKSRIRRGLFALKECLEQ